jgi:3-phenylpropionate/trans-cinnamate dioxygenase ferredoxin component
MSDGSAPGGGLPQRWWRTRSRGADRDSGGSGCSPAGSGGDRVKGQPAGQHAVDAGPADRILEQGRVIARVEGVEVLVVRTRRGIFAVENRCPHTGRQLTDAAVSGSKLTCMGHQRRYDLASGRPVIRTALPGTPMRVFDASIAGNRLWLAPRPRDPAGPAGAVARVPSASPHSRERH